MRWDNNDLTITANVDAGRDNKREGKNFDG